MKKMLLASLMSLGLCGCVSQPSCTSAVAKPQPQSTEEVALVTTPSGWPADASSQIFTADPTFVFQMR